MKQSIQLRLGQHLTMTPQLQQAIRLLQLSTVELNMEVQEALDSNMMLEVADDELREGADKENAASNGDKPSSKESQSDRDDNQIDSIDSSTAEGVQDIPDELPIDSAWEDVYDNTSMPTNLSASSASSSIEFDEHRSASESLQEQLLWQIEMAIMSDRDRVIAMTIIDSINEDGYLENTLEGIQEALGQTADMEDQVELDEIEAVLHRVQSLSPPGVGARDLGECLYLQLSECRADAAWLKEAKFLVQNHLSLMAARDFNQLMRRMKLSREELQQVVELIQSMDPRPGSKDIDHQIEYVIPDVYVRKVKGVWEVHLNQDNIPQLRINPLYAGMIQRADNSSQNTSLKTHMQEARWFIKSLQSRSETLLRVAMAIVERQRAFLDHGEEAMKPLVLHDIAETLGMHESTISRVTTKKYMHTPRGIFELKFFFSSHVSTTMGGECSSTAIRAVIKKLIAAENTVKPLSDSKIASMLVDQGIKVARRTVAKYREAMAIPPSNERKRLG